MAKKRYSTENNIPRLYAAAVRYPDFPQTSEGQRNLVKMFHRRIYDSGPKPVSSARNEVVYSVAQKLHRKSIDAFMDIEPDLTDAERDFIKKIQQYVRGTDREEALERIGIMVDGCPDSEIRPYMKKTADIILQSLGNL